MDTDGQKKKDIEVGAQPKKAHRRSESAPDPYPFYVMSESAPRPLI